VSLRQFMESEFDLVVPAPGGPIYCDADLYLAEVAALIKRKAFDSQHACEFLWMKIDQICNQEHFGQHDDALILVRLGQWVRELAS
jgi:hypothetical protein